MKNLKIKKGYYELSGFLLLDTSVFLAYRYHYKHYYELMVLGLFLIFYALDQRYILMPRYIQMYTRFIKAGIVGDLILGISLTKFWRYNYTSPLSYLPVYLIVYPLAGIIVVQMYVYFAKKLFQLSYKQRRVLTPKIYSMISICLGIIVALSLREIFQGRGSPVVMGFFFMAVCSYSILNLGYTANLRHKANVFDYIHSNPVQVLFVLAVVVYLNLFLMELPNVAAQEWTYTNYPFSSLQLWGIPGVAFLAWPILILFPVGVYYALPVSRRKTKLAQSALARPRR